MTTGIETWDAVDLPGPDPVVVTEAVPVPSAAPIDDAVGIGPPAQRRPLRRTARHPRGRHHRGDRRPVGFPSPDRRCTGGGQDRPRPGAGHRTRRRALACPGPPRPAALGHHRSHRLLARHGHLGVPTRARVRQCRPARRDEPDPSRAPSRPCSSRWRSSRCRSTASRGPSPVPTWSSGPRIPIGQVGTYPLAESQLDRFGLSTSIGYPDAEVETRLVLHGGGRYALDSLVPVADTARWAAGHRRHCRRPRRPGGRRVRRRTGAGHQDHRIGTSGRQPPGRHLPPPLRPGLRRPVGPPLRHPRRRPGRGHGVPVPPPHRRGHRRRGPAPRRPGHRRHPRTHHVSGADSRPQQSAVAGHPGRHGRDRRRHRRGGRLPGAVRAGRRPAGHSSSAPAP